MAWEKVKLGSVCKIGDGAHASLKRCTSGIPYLTAKNITQNGIDFQNMDYIDEPTFNKHFKDGSAALTRPLKDDILYSIIGSIGGVYLIRNEILGISSSVAIFRCNKDRVTPKYVYYFLKSSLFSSQVNAIKGGVAQGFMSLSKLTSVEISFPCNLKEQTRIADILSAYDNLIENNQKQIKLLEEAAQRLYKEWFIDLRFPGHETTKIQNGIPEGWQKKCLSETFSYVRGQSYTSKELSDDEGTLLVNLKNIQAWGGYKRSAEKRFLGNYKEEQSLSFGDIVMSVTDMTQERRLVGHVALVPNLKEPATFSMDLLKIIPKENIPSFFLYLLLRFDEIAENISKHANGVNVLHLKPESVMNLEITIPSYDVMKKADSIVRNLYTEIEILQNQILISQEARDRLLPKLMSGEIEV